MGHYVGSLKNRVRLQDEYECFLIIADLHTLTTNQDTSRTKENVRDLVLDQLSVGIDPTKVSFCIQSQIPEDQELFTILSMLVSKSRLERMPTLKEVMRDLKIEHATVGLLSYPVLQAADIMMVRANLVPIGKDQASHLELTRQIAEEFNRTYGEVFPVPEALIPKDIGTLPGTDGKMKMSKSVGNVINLSDTPETVRKQVMSMYTDPNRVHGDEPGKVDGNPVFVYLDAFSGHGDVKKIEDLKKRYEKGTVKDVEVKEYLVEVLERFLEPVREMRAKFESQPGLVGKILREGTQRAREEAQRTLTEVKRAMKLDYF